MTKRQQRIAQFVQKNRANILTDLAIEEFNVLPLGTSLICRLCMGFFDGYLAIAVRRIEDGYQWREESGGFYRKGFTAPTWRSL